MYCRFLEHTFLDTKTMAQLHQLTEELNLTENLEEAMLSRPVTASKSSPSYLSLPLRSGMRSAMTAM